MKRSEIAPGAFCIHRLAPHTPGYTPKVDGLDISFEVLHAIPGRVRLRIPETKRDPALADRIVEWLLGKQGIMWVRANPTCASVTVGYDSRILSTFVPAQQLRGMRIMQSNGKVSVDARHNPGLIERITTSIRRFSSLILPSAALAFSLIGRMIPVAPVYALVAAAATPIFARAAGTLRQEKRLGVDFLDATALAIMGAQRNLSTCAFMAWLIGIGEYIREHTARRCEKAIADLVAFRCDTAVVIRDGQRTQIPADSLAPSDRVIVNAGDCIPVDGRILRGRSGIDQMSLTGESALAERSIGDTVFAGSIAIDGELEIEALAVGVNTKAGSIVRILQSAPVNETKIEDYAARFADRLVLPTIVAAGLALGLTRSITRTLSMLIVDFGTGVRIAAPTAFLASMVHAARHNVVFKGGRAMEKLAHADTVVFDKTGTLTTGQPVVTDITPLDPRHSAWSILRLAAGAEAGLNHPIANALTAKARSLRIQLPSRIETRLRVGMGVKANIEGKEVIVGREMLMVEEGIDTSAAHSFRASSPIYVSVDGKLAGAFSYADQARPESAMVVEKLRGLGIGEVILATGDREDIAQATARELGIDSYISGAFPEMKLDVVRRLRASGRTVAVVGDGINDSLALAHADVAIATSGATDAAREAADVLLMEDDLGLLLEGVRIARSAVGLVRGNFAIVAVPNAAAILLAAAGLLGPPGATLLNNGSTVAAGLNSLRPLIDRRVVANVS